MTPEEIDAEARAEWAQNWDEEVARMRAAGAKEYAPNGLPITVMRHDALLECEHADHPDYKFPVFVEYIGPTDDMAEWEREYLSHPETHSLIYSDRSVALTMHECCYHLFLHAGDGECKTNPNLRLSAASCEAIRARLPTPPAPRPRE